MSFHIVKPKPRRANHGTITSRQVLDQISQDKFKKNTERAYKVTLSKFCQIFVDDILVFLNEITEGKKRQKKKIRYFQPILS